MKLEINNHWLNIATIKKTDNYNERKNEKDIELIVIHNISLPPNHYQGTYIEDFFCNQLDSKQDAYFETIKTLKVSAHLLIKRDASIVQFVAFNKRAWHAGDSNYQGKEGCNDFSIGIELQGSDTDAFEEKQYQVLNDVIDCLCDNYPKLNKKKIVGHSEIAPGRKTDPGPFFDWDKIS